MCVKTHLGVVVSKRGYVLVLDMRVTTAVPDMQQIGPSPDLNMQDLFVE